MVALAEIQKLSGTIARLYHPHRIILFGSHAYGRPGPDSDVDLMVIMPYRGRECAKSVDMLTRTSPSFEVDLIVCRPEEVRRGYAQYDPLMREAIDKGRVLYERNGSGVDRQRGRRLSHGQRAAPRRRKSGL